MDCKELIKSLLCNGYGAGEDADGCTNKKCKYRDADGACDLTRMCGDAAIAINELLAENQALRNAANGFKRRLEAAESIAEKAERERDAAIKMLRKIEWCNGCKNFRGLQGCRIDALVTCNPQNDMYVFGEWEE